jgi:hypothetical protein
MRLYAWASDALYVLSVSYCAAPEVGLRMCVCVGGGGGGGGAHGIVQGCLTNWRARVWNSGVPLHRWRQWNHSHVSGVRSCDESFRYHALAHAQL